MVESTWEWDLAVLEAVAELEGAHGTEPRDVAGHLESDVPAVTAALQRVASDDYITYVDASSMEGWDALAIRLTGKARRVVGQWPNENVAYEELLQLLEVRAGAEQDPDRRQALERARNFLEAAGSAAVGGVLHSLWRILSGM